MRRREFITLLGGVAAAWPFAARGQQPGNVRRIAWLSGATRASAEDALSGFQQGMRDFGYIEGKDFVIEWRFAEGRYERFADFAAEMVRLKVDVILLGTPAAIPVVQRATTTIPIIMAYSTDPVGNGFVASLAHPGGNTTGLASSQDDTAPKQLETLSTVVPHLHRIGFLANPANPNYSPVLTNAQIAAQHAGFIVVPAQARSSHEIERAFATLIDERVEAIMAVSDALFFLHRRQIAELALEHRLPSIFVQREYTAAGGLTSYGESLRDFFWRSASFVDKIFKGAKPADLPIEQPTRFYLVINLNTARALGLDVPPTLLARADEVIE